MGNSILFGTPLKFYVFLCSIFYETDACKQLLIHLYSFTFKFEKNAVLKKVFAEILAKTFLYAKILAKTLPKILEPKILAIFFAESLAKIKHRNANKHKKYK